MSPIVTHQDDIVRDSIIKNKERTKCYWEQLMLQAAEAAEANQTRPRSWDTSLEGNHSNRNSVSSIEYTEELAKDDPDMEERAIELEMTNVKDERRKIERQLAMDGDRERYDVMTMEDKIAMELQEMRQREEELRQLRKKFPVGDSLETKVEELTLSSLHTTDDGNHSEYGSEEKDHSLDGNSSRVISPDHAFSYRRTQSMDSMSSGHSSGSGGSNGPLLEHGQLPRRRNVVRPYEDPEDGADGDAAFKRTMKETPIEREIRLAKEREDELRREKGMTTITSETNLQKISRLKPTKQEAMENDPRDIQHKLATNRIQREIEEVSEKEDALRKEGKLVTPSEETVDNKVTRFTQLVEHSILENRYRRGAQRMKRSSSTSQLLMEVDQEQPEQRPGLRTLQPSARRYGPASTTQKGIMQRFIASKGRLSLNNPVTTNVNSPPLRYHSLDFQDAPSRRPAGEMRRKAFTSAEDKIQEELREMRTREEELRMQRARSMARSQPNLTEDIPTPPAEPAEPAEPVAATELAQPQAQQPLARARSSLSLIDDSYERVNSSQRPKKRFSLLEEWENRIQGVQQET